jgi:hypothetical protein
MKRLLVILIIPILLLETTFAPIHHLDNKLSLMPQTLPLGFLPSGIPTPSTSLKVLSQPVINDYKLILMIQANLNLVNELINRVNAQDIYSVDSIKITALWIDFVNKTLIQNTPFNYYYTRWQNLTLALELEHLFDPYQTPGVYATAVVVYWMDIFDQGMSAINPTDKIEVEWQEALSINMETQLILNNWIAHQIDAATALAKLAELQKEIGNVSTRVEGVLKNKYGLNIDELDKIKTSQAFRPNLNFVLDTPTPSV